MTGATRRLRVLTSAVGIAVLMAGMTVAADARTRHAPVTSWARQHAVRLSSVDPAAPLGDLAPLRRSIGSAQIVGLGESVHGAAQEETLKHRMLRLLVERMGFRSLAWEEQWTVGRRVNAYIRTGRGDLGTLLGRMSSQWQTREVADVLGWLRRYNAGHADDVRFVGVEYYLTDLLAYDAIERYVARVAADRLPELRRHMRVIRPRTADIFDHLKKYQQELNKQRYIRHARQVYELVASLPHTLGDRMRALTLQHARQIVFFYVHFSLPDTDALVYRDAHAARNLRWWRDFSGDKIAYWAASPHTANAPRLRMTAPPGEDMRFPSAGSYLRRWYGPRYLSVGFTFDHGAVSLDAGRTAVMPAPAQEWFEYPLGSTGLDQFGLDLRRAAPPPVGRWLHRPITTRGLPQAGPRSHMSGGTLGEWFDLIVHRQQVTPTRPNQQGEPR